MSLQLSTTTRKIVIANTVWRFSKHCNH